VPRKGTSLGKECAPVGLGREKESRNTGNCSLRALSTNCFENTSRRRTDTAKGHLLLKVPNGERNKQRVSHVEKGPKKFLMGVCDPKKRRNPIIRVMLIRTMLSKKKSKESMAGPGIKKCIHDHRCSSELQRFVRKNLRLKKGKKRFEWDGITRKDFVHANDFILFPGKGLGEPGYRNRGTMTKVGHSRTISRRKQTNTIRPASTKVKTQDFPPFELGDSHNQERRTRGTKIHAKDGKRSLTVT